MTLNQKLQPFNHDTICPKCGNGDEQSRGPFLVPGGPIATHYCPGGKEPEGEPDERNPLEAIPAAFSALAASLPGMNADLKLRHKINICAGITEEHLHRICSNCHFEFLMETKDSSVTAEVRS